MADPTSEAHPSGRRRALLASDDAALQRVLGDVVQARGWQLARAPTLAQATEMLAAQPAALLVVDAALADFAPDDCLRLRNLPAAGVERLLVVAAEPAGADRAAWPGADDLLPRPAPAALHAGQTTLAARRLGAVAAELEVDELRHELYATESALGAQKLLFERIFQCAPEGIVVADMEGRVLRANPEFCRMFGYAPHEVAGRTLDELIAPAAYAADALAITLRVQAGEPVAVETVRCRKDGTPLDVSLLAVPLRIRGDRVGICGIYRDITEKKRAERVLQRREQELEALLANAPDVVLRFDRDARLLYVSQGSRHPIARLTRSFVGQRVQEMDLPATVAAAWAEGVRRVVESGMQTEMEMRFALRGGERWFQVRLAPERTAEERVETVLAIARDVTEQKQVVEALRDSEQRYRALFDQSPVGVLHFDSAMRVRNCNARMAAMFGTTPERLAGLDLRAISDERVLPAVERTLGGATTTCEGRYTTGTGAETWLRATVSPLYDASGAVVGGLAVVEDISARKQAEAQLRAQAEELEQMNQALQERTRQMQAALEARNRLYAAMNHELRTPISAIMLYHDLLLSGGMGPLSAEQAESLGHAQRAARHLLEVVQDVLDLARLEADKLSATCEPVSIPDLIRELVSTIGPLAAEYGAEVHTRLPSEACVVTTDPRRVRQILLNLLSNAIKFGEGRPVQVECATTEAGVVVAVADQGPGIAPEDQARIFEEFVQLGRHRERGTGLGLAISRRLAELLGGSIEVESQLGRGSVFRLVLPETAAPPAEPLPAPIPEIKP